MRNRLSTRRQTNQDVADVHYCTVSVVAKNRGWIFVVLGILRHHRLSLSSSYHLHHNRRLGVFKNNSQAKATVHGRDLRLFRPHTETDGPGPSPYVLLIICFTFVELTPASVTTYCLFGCIDGWRGRLSFITRSHTGTLTYIHTQAPDVPALSGH